MEYAGERIGFGAVAVKWSARGRAGPTFPGPLR